MIRKVKNLKRVGDWRPDHMRLSFIWRILQNPGFSTSTYPLPYLKGSFSRYFYSYLSNSLSFIVAYWLFSMSSLRKRAWAAMRRLKAKMRRKGMRGRPISMV